MDIPAGYTVVEEVTKRKAVVRPVNERIARLRTESVRTPVTVSAERAKLITEFYKSGAAEGLPMPVQRAMAFRYLMERVSLPVEEGQLLVGLRGAGPQEAPTYPEICAHSIEDLEILNSREKMPYRVDEKTVKLYSDRLIPYWKGRTIRETLMNSLPRAWHDAYEAGIWTEFMEQRAPGHTAGGERIFKTGVLDLKEQINRKLADLRPEDPQYNDKRAELKAMDIAADAIIIYARRYAEKLDRIAEAELDPARKAELTAMARICRKVPARAPETFHEALQHYWFVHVGVIYETNPWDSLSPGRIDQHLEPFLTKDTAAGKLTGEQAKELLQALWIKINNQPAVPKVGVTAEESFTYNDFCKINVGGLKKDGSDGVNEVSYLVLEALDEIRTLQPNTALLFSNKNPERLLRKALQVVAPGFGEPPFFNCEGVIVKMLRQGKTLEDARTAGVSGCVESGAFGQEAYILSGYFNLPKILEITLNNGIDPRSRKQLGLETGDPTGFNGFTELWEAFVRQAEHFMEIKMRGNDLIEEIYARQLPVPFKSLWIDDCVENARDYNAGGARYNTQYLQMVGLGTVVFSLSALKFHIFDRQTATMSELLDALAQNFAGQHEMLRQLMLNKTPRFGEDDDYADQIAIDIVDMAVKLIENHPPSPVRKASKRAYFLPTTVHVYFGKVTGPTPDGRKAGLPISEGISPVQGSDRKGIAAVLRSVAKCDWDKTGGALLNQKLTPDLLEGAENNKKVARLIRTFFNMGGHHIQFNVVSTELLREALARPADFQDLMVRVAGYSDYFVNLPRGLQEEIIARTAHA